VTVTDLLQEWRRPPECLQSAEDERSAAKHSRRVGPFLFIINHRLLAYPWHS